MRALALLLPLVACGYPEPTDRCEGPCALFAIDRSIAFEFSELWFEGTFEGNAQVKFPGTDVTYSLDIRADHRAAVLVPVDATAGDLMLITHDGETSSLPFRRSTFRLAMQPFSASNEQGDYARTNYVDRVHLGGTAMTIGNRVYLIGGTIGGLPTGDVEVANAGLDGSMGKLKPDGQLQTPRAYHTAVRVGRYVYVIGGIGGGPMPSVERALLNNDLELEAFETVSGVSLNIGRGAHASAIIGNFVYVIGGRTVDGELADVERAPILDNDELGSFEQVPGISLKTSRSHFAIAKLGNRLFAIGGLHDGKPIDSVERMELFGSGYVADFELVSHLVQPRANHVCAIVGDTVYVIGGSDNAGTIASIEEAPISMVDSLAFTTSVIKLGEPKQNAALTSIGNYVYLIGGSKTVGMTVMPSQVVERASMVDVGDLGAFVVSPTSLNTARTRHASFVIGNKLYVIGGLNLNGNPIDTIEVAPVNPDGALGGFTTISMRLNTARYGHEVLINNDVLYVMGGKDDQGNVLDTIETAVIHEDGTIEPLMNFAQKLPRGRTRFTVFAAETYAYLLGGEAGPPPPSPTSVIDRIKFTSGTEFTIGPFLYTTYAPREGAASISLGQYVYVLSGQDGVGYRTNVRAPLAPEGGIIANDFVPYAYDLVRNRHGHTATQVGNSLYVVGGINTSGLPSGVEATKVGPDGAVTPFAVSNLVTLVTERTDHTTVTLGNYVYLIGGTSTGGAPLASLDFATIR